jgi:hypothetical protein
MKRLAVFLVLSCAAFAADTAKIDLTVTGIPANATEVVVVFDAGSAPAAGYDDAAPVVVPPPAAPAVPVAAPADPAAPAPAAAPVAPPRRRRGNAGPALPPPTRASVTVKGATTATLSANVPVGENYQARVLALRGSDSFPSVLAGGRLTALKLTPNATLPLDVALKAPALQLAPGTPTTVAPGARFTLAGTLTDAAHALGTKNRMRVWISEGAPPTANFAGRQVSTIDVTTTGADIAFSFELTAPTRPTTLYLQFGELPADFARADGQQAAFVVLPDVAAGAKPLELRVQ